MNIGEQIKKIRTEKKLSTYDVANMTGISQSVISKLENGKRKFDNEILEKLAEAFGVSTDRLTGESISCIIENKLEGTGLTLEDISIKAGIPLRWLQNIEDFIPDEQDYAWATKLAEAIGLPGSTLRSALARQEPPMPDDLPRITAEEAFRQAQEDFKGPYIESQTHAQDYNDTEQHYYLNDESRQIAQEVFENPDLRSLFHVARDIDPNELRAHIDFMKRLKSKEKKDDDYEGC